VIRHILEERFTQAEQHTLCLLPFEVPPGTTRIEVRYRFSEGSILDLGLFDPRLGPFPSREGFRGWSGSARGAIFVATDDATPGYLPGPLQPGRWHVALGLAKVASQGCDYRVEIALDDAPRTLYEPAFAPPRPRGGSGWYKGDLQSHTHHSDARGSLDDLVQAANARSLDFLAVTDHNTISHHRAIAARYDALLREGRRLTLVGGSDRHQPPWPDTDPQELWVGSPTTWVYADELSVAGLLQGLERGRVCVSESPTGPSLDISAGEQAMGARSDHRGPVEVTALVRGGEGERLRWLGPRGVLRDVAIASDPFEDRWTLDADTFVRAEVVAADPQAVLDALASRLKPSAKRAAAFLAGARQHPYVRCLSNPLYFS
jgi:hypothetical protein